jgi:hypothetical protein
MGQARKLPDYYLLNIGPMLGLLLHPKNVGITCILTHKHQLTFNGLSCVIYQKVELFITTAVKGKKGKVVPVPN